MKIYKTAFMLACFSALASSAIAQDNPKDARFIYGDGATAFILSADQSLFLPQGEAAKSVSVSKHLGARGDVVYKDADGHIFVRMSISGAATYYPQEGSKGLPVSRIDIASPISALDSIAAWGKAYQYKGAKTARPEERPAQTHQEPSN